MIGKHWVLMLEQSIEEILTNAMREELNRYYMIGDIFQPVRSFEIPNEWKKVYLGPERTYNFTNHLWNPIDIFFLMFLPKLKWRVDE